MGTVKRTALFTSNFTFNEDCAWEDRVWRFPISTAGARQINYSMNWAIPLADGQFFTDSPFAAELQAWKQVLWTMLTAPPDGRPRKGSFCGKFGTTLRLLAPWMVSTGRRDLSNLDQVAFQEFLDMIGEKFASGDDSQDIVSMEKGRITDGAFATYLTIFSLPYFLRNELAAAGLPFPSEDPLSGKSALDIASEFCSRRPSPTREVPDAIYVSAVNGAMAMLSQPWLEALIDLNQVISSSQLGDIEKECAFFRNAFFPGTPRTTTSAECVRATLQQVRAACQVLIQATSALRVSEFCGIRSLGRNNATGLPSCITIERTFDDEYEVFSLNADLFKHTPSSEPVTWVLGMRPTGSNYLPPPVQAIDVLERLDDGWRQRTGIDTLLIQFATRAFPPDGRLISMPTSDIARKHQQRWLIETGCAKEEDRISTHMWRKTFARYLIRVSADLLPAISHHLQHLSVAMTEIGYCKNDSTMRDIIAGARIEEAGSIILGAITGKRRVEGPVAHEIRSLAAELSQRFGNRPSNSLSRDIEQEVRERRIELYGNEIGWCVFRGDSARCHLLAVDPTPAFLRLAPAFGNRRPDVCQKCANFALGDEHVGFWQERRSSFKKQLAACGPETPPSIKTCLMRSLDRCDTVLSWMGIAADD